MLLSLLRKGRPLMNINTIIERLFYQPSGQMLISVIFGFALAFMFRKACKGEHCIVIEPPPMEDIQKYVYTIDGVCYRYVPKMSECVLKK